MPGGNASMILQSMGEEGKARVKDFVATGGGYIGVCAGAVAASCTWPDYLQLAAVNWYACLVILN